MKEYLNKHVDVKMMSHFIHQMRVHSVNIRRKRHSFLLKFEAKALYVTKISLFVFCFQQSECVKLSRLNLVLDDVFVKS